MNIDPSVNIIKTPILQKNPAIRQSAPDLSPTDSFTRSDGQQMNLITPGKVSAGASVTNSGALFRDMRARFDTLWEADLGDPGASAHFDPVITDDSMVLSFNGITHKYDLDGKELWKVETASTGRSLPVLDPEGNVYVLGEKNLISLDSSGQERWHLPMGERNWSRSPILADDGKLYVIDDAHKLHCVSTAGKEEWSVEDPQITWKKPQMDSRGILYAGGSGEEGFTSPTIAVDTGKSLRGKRKITEIPVGEHTVHHEILRDKNGNVFGFRDGKFRATDANGKEMWSLKLPDNVMSVSQLFGPDGNLYIRESTNSMAICVTPDGQEKWRFSTDPNKEPLSGNFAWGQDGTTYITGYGGNWKMYAVSPDGSARWTGVNNSHITSPKVGPDGTVYANYEITGIKAFSQETGKVIAEFPIRTGFADNYHFTANGDIIVVNDKGKMMKVRCKTKEKVAEEIMKDAVDEKGKEENSPKIDQGDGWVEIGGVRLPVKKK